MKPGKATRKGLPSHHSASDERYFDDCIACNDANPVHVKCFCTECWAIIPNVIRRKIRLKLTSRKPWSNRTKMLLRKTINGIRSHKEKVAEIEELRRNNEESETPVRTPENGDRDSED